LNKKLYWQTPDFKLCITKILEPKHTAQRYASVIWNLAKWNSVKWNETRRIGAIFACFRVARVCQHQLGFLVFRAVIDAKLTYTSSAQLHADRQRLEAVIRRSDRSGLCSEKQIF